jgi:hypothetical protein
MIFLPDSASIFSDLLKKSSQPFSRKRPKEEWNPIVDLGVFGGDGKMFKPGDRPML